MAFRETGRPFFVVLYSQKRCTSIGRCTTSEQVRHRVNGWFDYTVTSAEERLQIILHCSNAAYAEFFYKHIGHIGRKEGGQGGTKVYVLDTK